VSEVKLTKQDYWKLKKDDLIAILVEKKIPFDPDNMDRKAAIEALVHAEAEAGDLQGAVEIDTEGNVGKPKVKREYVDIVFHNQDGQPKYVFLGINGRFLYLPRECAVRMPAEFMEVVRNAYVDKPVQFEVNGKLVYRDVRTPRFVYEVLGKGVI